MFLAFDIGNTNIKTGLFLEDKLSEFNSFPNYSSLLNYLKNIKFDKAAISSVVPKMEEKLIKDLFSLKKIEPFVITKSVKFSLKIIYDSIDTLGIDRICGVEGAFSLFNKSEETENYNSETYILSIDFGTATTVNIIRFPGEFIGGIIAPGLNMMFEGLNKNTSQLPNVDLSSYKNLIGTDTKSSIASGVLNSTIGLIEKVIKFLKSEKGEVKIYIFVTGGNAETIMNYLPFKFKYEKGLVLAGIKSIYNKNFPQ
jgi:type III pantothenate kinase